jgi:predicted enzyme related to lactoylglutathione lyase
MPLRESAPVGAPVWIDLFTTNPDKSRAFYGELFGWKSEEPNPQFGGYFNFTKDDRMIAGGMRNDGAAGTPDLWTVYLAVADAEATTTATAAHGGTVDSPAMAVADLGTMAILTDPGGAHLGLWQPGLHKGFGIVNEPGAPAWFELHTRAYDASVAFYRDVFGWDTYTHSDTPEFRYTTLGNGDDALAGVMDAATFLPRSQPSYWSVYFLVDDTDAALAQVTDLGGAVVEPAQDTPYGRLAAAADSTGARFKLMARI